MDKMSKLKEVVGQRKEVEDQLNNLNKQIDTLYNELAPQFAKHQVDEIINHGRSQYKITRLSGELSYREDKISVRYYGHKILKAGNLHKNESDLYWLEWE